MVKSDTISFFEFIDIITEGKGDQIKENLIKIQLKSKKKKQNKPQDLYTKGV